MCVTIITNDDTSDYFRGERRGHRLTPGRTQPLRFTMFLTAGDLSSKYYMYYFLGVFFAVVDIISVAYNLQINRIYLHCSNWPVY